MTKNKKILLKSVVEYLKKEKERGVYTTSKKVVKNVETDRKRNGHLSTSVDSILDFLCELDIVDYEQDHEDFIHYVLKNNPSLKGKIQLKRLIGETL